MNKQLSLFVEPQTKLDSIESLLDQKHLGTFRDSLKAPIHRWFKYPAGYSYRFVESFLKIYNLDQNSWILDPFAGTGTTNVVAQKLGINSMGIEAHPFVHWVAQVKCFWDYDLKELKTRITQLINQLKSFEEYPGDIALKDFPELVHKCFSPLNLWHLKCIRDKIENFSATEAEKNFFKLALTDTLRTASSAGSGWPYVAPTKYHEKNEQPALEVFVKTLHEMYQDIYQIRLETPKKATTKILLHDTRCQYPLTSESIDLAITSPPYLNNYDYADRTRLEMYFFDWAKTWGEITKQVRNKLIVAATTQVSREKYGQNPLSSELQNIDPYLYKTLSQKIKSLDELRLTKGGKKNYDLMVAGYFNDMLPMLRQVYRVLKPGKSFVLMLGDSAPYGVHIPTEEYLGRLAMAIGFSNFSIYPIRTRGEKWKNNPQRHKVPLKESILVLEKIK